MADQQDNPKSAGDVEKMPLYYGKGGRLKKDPHPAMVDSAYKHECSDADVLCHPLHEVDLAHAMVLIEAGVIPDGEQRTIIQGLVDLQAADEGRFAIDPRLGDLYNCKDAALRQLIGDSAGWLHAGRPRREALNMAYLMASRDRVLNCIEALAETIGKWLAAADAGRGVLMPDFTYLHPAHPTTLGHYLSAFSYPLLRDLDRLRDVYEALNKSTAGAGSSNGSRLAPNRDLYADLLGFEGVVRHSRDAMWQADVPLQAMSALTCLMVDLDRPAEDFQIWSTPPYGLIDFDDGLFRASVIMPQKRNPYPLAYVRGLTGKVIGELSTFAAVGKTTSGNPDSRIFIYGDLPVICDRVSEAVRLMGAVVDSLSPQRERMLELLRESFVQGTDLADVMISSGKLDYRVAHQVIGVLAKRIAEKDLEIAAIDAPLLNATAEQVAGVDPELSEEQISEALDYHKIVEARVGYGGAADAEVAAMLEQCRTRLDESRHWLTTRKTALSDSAECMRSKVAEIIN